MFFICFILPMSGGDTFFFHIIFHSGSMSDTQSHTGSHFINHHEPATQSIDPPTISIS